MQWESFVWTLLAVAASIALVAILSPRVFARLNAWSSVWIDIDRLARKSNTRIDIDDRIIPHCRLLGAIVIVAAGILASFYIRFQYVAEWIALPSLGLVGAIGLLALFSPLLFSRLARLGAFWVDIDKYADKMNCQIEIDLHILRHCRLFGAVVMGVVVILTALLVFSA